MVHRGMGSEAHSVASTRMTGAELSRRMADAGISVEGLGALMQTHVDEVREWQGTPRDLSKALADRIHWHLAVLDHERRMRESGLPTCPWAEAHETKMSQAGGMKETEERRVGKEGRIGWAA